MNPVLSLIFPMYNIGDKAIPLIESLNLIDRDLDNQYELIFIDDGSSIDEMVVLKNLKKKFFYFKKENNGLSLARYTGLHKANGKYVWFIDPDDHIVTENFSKLIQLLQNTPYDVIGFNTIEFYENKTFPEKSLEHYTNIFKLDKFFPNFQEDKIYTPYEEGLRACSAWSKVFSRKFLIDNNINFDYQGYHEDTYVWFQCFSKIKSYMYLNEELYVYHIDFEGDSIMRKMEKNRSLNTKYMMSCLSKVFDYYSQDSLYQHCNFKEINKIINHYIYSDLYTTKKYYRKYYRDYKKQVNKLYKNHKLFKKITNKSKRLYVKSELWSYFKKIVYWFLYLFKKKEKDTPENYIYDDYELGNN